MLTVLKLLFGLGILAGLLYFVDLREVLQLLADLNVWYVLAAVAVIYLDRGLMAYKWGLLLSAIDVRARFSTLLKIYCVSPLVGMVLPATIGGDAFRIYALRRNKISARAVLVSIVAERIIGFLSMLLLALLSLGLASYFLREDLSRFSGVGWVLLAAAIIGFGLVGMAVALRGGLFTNLISRFSRYSLVEKLNQTCALFYEYRNQKRSLGIVVGWTFIEQTAPIVVTFLLVKALGINVSLVYLVMIVPLIVLAIRIPISFEGIGVQEGLYVGLFALVGISAEQALLLSAVNRAANLLCALPWGLYYLIAGHGRDSMEQHAPRVNPV